MNAMLSIPFRQARLAGEGRVRGQRDGLPTCNGVAGRIPLSPALSPIAYAIEVMEQRPQATA
jgi:hypothetical protein